MNSNAEHTYPRDYSDDGILDRIRELLNTLEDHEFQENIVFRLYPQVTLGQTELQSRASKRSLRASGLLSKTALGLSVASMIFSGFVAWSSLRSADEWRTDQLAILGSMNSNISSSRESIAARASADAVTLQKWRNDQMSILRNIDQNLLGILADQ